MNIREIAAVIRTKTAGPYWFSADIMFDNDQFYQAVKDYQAITRERVAKLYDVDVDKVSEVIYNDAGKLIKVSVRRPYPSGDVGDSDVLGMQQDAPLLAIDIPLKALFK